MTETLTNILPTYLIDLLVATGIGFIIGLEREFKLTLEKDEFAGIRTYPIISILGFVTTILAQTLDKGVLIATLPAMIVFIGIVYYVRSQKGHMGLGSNVGLVIAFVLGSLSALHLIREALAVAVITTTLLSLKGQFKAFVTRLTQDEIFAFIKFIILSMLVLPFLPDQDFGPGGIFNPSEIGMIVVIISSLSFVGYLLIKFIGSSKGILLTAVFGGLFSSTGVTWVFADRSRKADDQHIDIYAGGILLASSIMFLRVAVVTAIFSNDLFWQMIIPCTLMAATGILAAWLILKKSEAVKEESQINLGNPVNILNAIAFGLLYVAISLMVYYADRLLGYRGLIASGLISGLVDVDAITISMSRLTTMHKLNLIVSVIIIAMLSNTLVKLAIALLRGSKKLRQRITIAISAVALVGILYTLFLYM